MSAEVPVWVLVERHFTEWVQVSSVTKAEAKFKALELPGVVCAIDATYEQPQPGAGEP